MLPITEISFTVALLSMNHSNIRKADTTSSRTGYILRQSVKPHPQKQSIFCAMSKLPDSNEVQNLSKNFEKECQPSPIDVKRDYFID